MSNLVTSISYNEFVNLLNNVYTFDSKKLNLLYEKYGKEIIDSYFEEYFYSLTGIEVLNFINKFLAYFQKRNITDFFEPKKIKQTFDQETKEEFINLKKIKPLLTIINPIEDDFRLYPTLNLGRIFLSVKTIDDLEIIKRIKKFPYLMKDDNIFKEDIKIINEFLKISSGKILSKEELIKKFPFLTFDDETIDLSYQIDLLEKYITSRFNIYNNNFGLVVFWVKRKSNKVPFEDNLQEGLMGLIKAINRYDLNKKCRFSTYATWWINACINSSMLKKYEMIKKPQIVERYEKFVYGYILANGYEPTLEECSFALKLNHRDIEEINRIYINLIPLDDEVISGYLSEYLDSSSPSLEESFIEENLVEYILEQMNSCLTEVERNILLYRFGFDSTGKSHTIREIAEKYKLNTTKTKSIENIARRKLVRTLEIKEIVEEYKMK